MSFSDLPYRPCSGIMLLNADNKVFVGQRIDTAVEAWQMPQGGIDEDEDPEKAAFRELKEEIGTTNASIIAKTKSWLYYDLPENLIGTIWEGKYRGQKQIWFLMRFLGENSEINLETEKPEFNAWKWIEINDLPNVIVPFKKPVYKSLIKEFSAYFE